MSCAKTATSNRRIVRCAIGWLAAVPAAAATTAAWPVMPGVEPCGVVEVPARSPQGDEVNELSGLAGDAERLFAVSDQGWLVTLAPVFSQRRLTAVAIERVVALRDEGGVPLPVEQRDAEGLELASVAPGSSADAELWISFETEPRIERYGLDGRRRGALAASDRLSRAARHASPARAFEALTALAGQPLTALESPAGGSARSTVPLLDRRGVAARFPLADAYDSALVGLDRVRGRTVVALERSFHPPERRVVITLSTFELSERRGGVVEKRTLAVLDSHAGHEGIDNFEGVVALEDGRVLMVSDDNRSALQRQKLLCLDIEALGPGDGTP